MKGLRSIVTIITRHVCQLGETNLMRVKHHDTSNTLSKVVFFFLEREGGREREREERGGGGERVRERLQIPGVNTWVVGGVRQFFQPVTKLM